MEISTIGIDLGKTVFHLVGVNARGEVVVQKGDRRRNFMELFLRLNEAQTAV